MNEVINHISEPRLLNGMVRPNHYKVYAAEFINPMIGQLPIAEMVEVQTTDGREVKGFKAVMVKNQCVSVPTNKYQLVQHEEAFRPIIDGLTISGRADWRFQLWNTNKRAGLNIMVGHTQDGKSHIEFGFSVTNSFTAKEAINFGFKSLSTKRWIEICGFRQVCSNGMKVRVPMDEAEFVAPVEREEIKRLLGEVHRIEHIGKIESKMKQMQYITEAYLLLEKPLKRMITLAEKFEIADLEAAEKMVKKYVGRRLFDKILEQYNHEEATLWGLYNSMTWVASHTDIAQTTRNGLIDKAANMLTEELTVKDEE